MQQPDQAFIDAIARGEVQITELYDLELTNGVNRYFTSHDEDIFWSSPAFKYESLPIVRGPISTKVNLEADQVELTLANITTDLAEMLQANILDGAKVTIKRILYNEEYSSGMELTLFIGTVDVTFNRQMLVLACTSILDSLNVMVPKNIYQEPCNYRLFDVGCALAAGGFETSSFASADSTDLFTLTDVSLAVVDNYFALGRLEITSGRNKGAKRLIRRQIGDDLTVAVAFQYSIQTNDAYKAYAGCDKRPEVCRDTFTNKENFYGFSYVPKPEETMFG